MAYTSNRQHQIQHGEMTFICIIGIYIQTILLKSRIRNYDTIRIDCFFAHFVYLWGEIDRKNGHFIFLMFCTLCYWCFNRFCAQWWSNKEGSLSPLLLTTTHKTLKTSSYFLSEITVNLTQCVMERSDCASSSQ